MKRASLVLIVVVLAPVAALPTFAMPDAEAGVTVPQGAIMEYGIGVPQGVIVDYGIIVKYSDEAKGIIDPNVASATTMRKAGGMPTWPY